MKRTIIILSALFLVFTFFGTVLAADDYPKKPITFIIPWGAGGMTDVSGRLLADKFKAELGQPIVVINKIDRRRERKRR